jgi:DGQHR domain-containing protein
MKKLPLKRRAHQNKNISIDQQDPLELPVMKGKVLGVDVYRGFAKLCDLSNISAADVFDQKTNPLGTQRDLSPKHARDAYSYVKNREFAFWPEVFLSIRNSDVFLFEKSNDTETCGTLKIFTKIVSKSKNISISRVDGNHRLHYAGGNHSGFPPITKEVSFCLAYNLKLEEEIALFRDINDNQRRMNTSHLDNIESRLTPKEIQKIQDPTLFIAKKLGEDHNSSLFDKIYEGGKKAGYFSIPLRSLKTGIQYMLSQPSKLTELPSVDVQYAVIRNYFAAVKQWIPQAWHDPNKYLVLRGAGLWAICFIGATVIDKTLSSGKFEPSDMLKVLKSGASWNWSRTGDFAGYSGRGGATKIRDQVVSEFKDDTGVSIKDLAEKILKS